MLLRASFVLFALSLVGCGVFPKEKRAHESKGGADAGSGDGSADDASDGPGDGSTDGSSTSPSIAYDLNLIVREPGMTATDAASLFIIKTEQGSPVIKDVAGPQFLGNAAVGVLDASTIDKLFAKLSSPLPKDAKTKLLDKYAGAAVVYFEGYKGRLCDGGQYRLELKTEYADVRPLASFDFVGSQGQDGNCFFNSLSLLTSTHSTK